MRGEVVGEGFAFLGETDFGEAKDALAFFQRETMWIGNDADDGTFNIWRREEGFFRDRKEDLRRAEEGDGEREEAVFPVFGDNAFGDFFLNQEDDFVGCGIEGDRETNDFSGDGVGDIAEERPLSEP